MTEHNPPLTNDTIVDNLAEKEPLPLKEQTDKTITDFINKTLENRPDRKLTPEEEEKVEALRFSLNADNSVNREIEDIQSKKETGSEPYVAPVVKITTSNKNFLKRASSFTLSLLGLGAINATAEVKTNSSDSLENKIVKTRTVEDSTKTNKSNTVEVKKMGINWVEANENVGGLDLEAKAIVPFSDTTKMVWIFKFASGSAEEMIAAAKAGGYKILSAKDFQKMYLENQSQSKQLRQTFSGEQVADVDDTKLETYQSADAEGVKTGLKETHGVYPYIGLNGSLNRYEKDENLNSEAGLAVYKENK